MADMSTNTPAAVGHNNPPSDIEILSQRLNKDHAQAIKAMQGHLDIVGNMPERFTSENEAKYVTDLIKLMQNLQKELERRRTKEKAPYLTQGKYVDKFFGEYDTQLQAGIDKSSKLLVDYLAAQAEKERLEREAAARDAQELNRAALANVANIQQMAPEEAQQAVAQVVRTNEMVRTAESIAAAPVREMARVTGATSKAALATKWIGIVKDAAAIDLTKLRPYFLPGELQNAVDRFVAAGGRQCEGAEIKETTFTKVK